MKDEGGYGERLGGFNRNLLGIVMYRYNVYTE